VRTAFNGEGARKYGGRWNHPGTRIVYTADARSLALLEILAPIERGEVHEAYSCIPAVFEDFLTITLDRRNVPYNWQECPPPTSTMDIGTRWARGLDSAVLRVPSVIVPSEYNFLLNPEHPDFSHIEIGPPEAFTVDPRFREK
jgi:RES domain-containing protein